MGLDRIGIEGPGVLKAPAHCLSKYPVLSSNSAYLSPHNLRVALMKDTVIFCKHGSGQNTAGSWECTYFISWQSTGIIGMAAFLLIALLDFISGLAL